MSAEVRQSSTEVNQANLHVSHLTELQLAIENCGFIISSEVNVSHVGLDPPPRKNLPHYPIEDWSRISTNVL